MGLVLIVIIMTPLEAVSLPECVSKEAGNLYALNSPKQNMIQTTLRKA